METLLIGLGSLLIKNGNITPFTIGITAVIVDAAVYWYAIRLTKMDTSKILDNQKDIQEKMNHHSKVMEDYAQSNKDAQSKIDDTGKEIARLTGMITMSGQQHRGLM